MSVDVEGENPDCPDGWDEVTPLTLARACPPPEPDFTLEPTGPLSWRVHNQTPTDPYGCLTDLSWQVFAGPRGTGTPIPGLDSRHWEPEFRVPGPGRYTVVLHVGGVAGTRAATLTFDADGGRLGCQ